MTQAKRKARNWPGDCGKIHLSVNASVHGENNKKSFFRGFLKSFTNILNESGNVLAWQFENNLKSRNYRIRYRYDLYERGQSQTDRSSRYQKGAKTKSTLSPGRVYCSGLSAGVSTVRHWIDSFFDCRHQCFMLDSRRPHGMAACA